MQREPGDSQIKTNAKAVASVLHYASKLISRRAKAPRATPAEALDIAARAERLQPNAVDDWQAKSRIETPAKKLAQQYWPVVDSSRALTRG